MFKLFLFCPPHNPKSLTPLFFVSFFPLSISGYFHFIYFSLSSHIFFPCYIVGFSYSFRIFLFLFLISFIFPWPVSHHFHSVCISLLFLLANSSLRKQIPLLCTMTKENIKVKSWSSCTIYQINADSKLSFRYFKHLKHRYFWVDSYLVLSSVLKVLFYKPWGYPSLCSQ